MLGVLALGIPSSPSPLFRIGGSLTWRSLLLPGRPSTIAGLVVAVVVDSIQRVLRTRFWPHVAKEGLKGVPPTLTHLYATPAIPRVMGDILIATATLHGDPCSVFRREARAVRGPLLAQGVAMGPPALPVEVAPRLGVVRARAIRNGAQHMNHVTTNTGFVLPHNPHGWFQSGESALLNLELSGAVSVDGSLTYIEAE